VDVNGSSVAGSAEELCRRVHPRLVKTLALFCGEVAAAEDLAQEALVRAWDRWPAVSEMANPEGWVFRVAFNLATSRARRRQGPATWTTPWRYEEPSLRSHRGSGPR
jgi:DNA-directed RNA polymerase specialized sigma24 family protein